MALIRYSTADQLDANLEKITIKLTLIQKNDRIDQADKFIHSKLAKLVDFAIIDALADVPDWLNCLSQYKAAELAIAKVYGAKRDIAEISDLKYWADLFMELLKECLDGDIDFGDAVVGSGIKDFQWDARRHVKPALGTGEYGEYENLEDLQDEREYDDTGD